MHCSVHVHVCLVVMVYDTQQACSVGDVETVRAWLDSGGDVNMQSKSQCTTPLAKAASKGQMSVAQVNIYCK
jgi:Ankyrin repeats (many copies)